VEGEVLRALGLILLGFGTGGYGTLIGAGGGFVLVPVLLLLYPDDAPHLITSISLAVVFFNAASGSEAYARMGRIDHRSGLLFAAATIPGAVLGALTTSLLPRRLFDITFGVLLVAASAYLVWRSGAAAQGTARDHALVSPLSKPSQKISPGWSPYTPVLRSLTLRIGQSARPGSA
jgi:uncharacterized protein